VASSRGRSEIARVVRVEAGADAVLLGDHAAPAALGGMRRQGRFDVEAFEGRKQVAEADAPGLEIPDRLGDGLGAGGLVGRCRLAMAVDAGDMDLFGLVAKVEADREMLQKAPNGLGGQVRKCRIGTSRRKHVADDRSQFGKSIHGAAVRLDLGETTVEPRDVAREQFEHGGIVRGWVVPARRRLRR